MSLPEAAGVVTENRALKTAPWWRREPYVVFFPLGILLSWAGVGRWLAFALGGRSEDYLGIYIFHGMTQVQGFLLCFAIGFLFTMIPRRTGTSPPSAAEMAVAVAAPVLTVGAAWTQQWALSQLGWMVAVLLLVAFVLRRFLSSGAKRRPPASFVWIPVSLLMGLAGSAMTGARGLLGDDWMWLHTLGQQLVLQGVFLGLVLGVGGLVLPMMTRGEAPRDVALSTRSMAAVGGHLLAALLLVESFVLHASGEIAAGCGLRAAVVTIVLLAGPQLWRPPSAPGWNRRVIWVAAWMLPAGFGLAAVLPDYYQAGLHISFIGGFGLLTLAVSTHVVLGHGDRQDLLYGRTWQIGAIAMLMAAAMTARVAMVVQPLHRNAWMATAALFFLAATLLWGLFLAPTLLARRT